MAELTLCPNFIVTENIRYDTLVSSKFGGLELRRSKRQNGIRFWELIYTKRTEAEYNTIRALFNSKYGNVYHFTWINPIDSVEYYVRFLEPKLKFQMIQYNVFSFNFTLEQILYWSTTSTTTTSTTSTSTTSTSTSTTSTSTTSTSTTTTT